MSNSTLDQVIDLIKQTGDNCIVLDSDGNPAYVVSKFEKYRKKVRHQSEMANLSENKSNIDNSEVKTVDSNPFASDMPEDSADNSLTYAKNDESEDNSEEKYYFEPID